MGSRHQIRGRKGGTPVALSPSSSLETLESRLLLSGDFAGTEAFAPLEVLPDQWAVEVDLDNKDERVSESDPSLILTYLASGGVNTSEDSATSVATSATVCEETPVEQFRAEVAQPVEVAVELTGLVNPLPAESEGMVQTDGLDPMFGAEASSIEIRGPPATCSLSTRTCATGEYSLEAESLVSAGTTDVRSETVWVVPDLPGLYPVDPDAARLVGQMIYLEFDGQEDVTYDGPVTVGPFDVPAFQTPGELAGREAEIIVEIVERLERIFAGSGVIFTTVEPATDTLCSTVFIGGDDSDFTQYGPFLGLAEQADIGNTDRNDKAFVFSDNIVSDHIDGGSFVNRLANLVCHETGHLLGYEHNNEDPNGGVLSLVAVADRFESNDSFAAATDLERLGNRTEADLSIDELGDEDYLLLTAVDSGMLNVDILFSHSLGDLDLKVYDYSQSLLASSTSYTDNESVSVAVTRDRSYYVCVYGFLMLATNPDYDLVIDGPEAPADRFEPNDSFAAATDLGTLGDRTEANLTIHESGNDDYFLLTAADSGTLNADIFFSHSLGDLDLRFYDYSQSLLASSTSYMDNESVSVAVAAGQTYYVRVLGYADATHPDYDLMIDGPEVATDRFEPNDSFAAATYLGTLGDRTEADLTIQESGNDDYYLLTAACSGTLNVDILFSHSLGDLQLAVYDSSQSLLADSTSITDNESVSVAVTGGQTYYVRVLGYVDATHPDYDLVIDGPEVAADRFEPNDSFAAATYLGTLGDRTETDLTIQESGNDDYYLLTAAYSETLNVDILFSHSWGDLQLAVYDSSQSLLASSTSITDNESVSLALMGGQTYYLRVYGYAGSTHPDYDLVIDGPEDPSTVGNTNVFTQLSTSTNRLAMPFVMPEAGTLESVSIYHEGGAGNVLLAVYNDSGGLPGSRLGVTASALVNATEGWQTVNLTSSVSVSNNQMIWLAWVFQSNPGIRYEVGTPGRADSGQSWSGDMPAFFGVAMQADLIYSVYATYTPLVPLNNDVPETHSTIPKDFSFTVTSYNWCGVGILPSTNHNIRVDDNSDFSSPYESSAYGGTITDVVVANGRNWGNAIHYAQVYDGSASNYSIEAEWNSTEIIYPGFVEGQLDSGEVLDMYEVYLQAGQAYKLRFESGPDWDELSAYLFSPTRDSGSCADYDFVKSPSHMDDGEDPLFFEANQTGYWGIAVINERGVSNEYLLGIFSPFESAPPYYDKYITGTKWVDLDRDGSRDPYEPGIERCRMYLDLNENGQLDAGEPSEVTDVNGTYVFDKWALSHPSNTYTVAEELGAGWEQTFPGGDGTHTVEVPPNTMATCDFGNYGPAVGTVISGNKWHDVDGDGIKDMDEPGLEGWTIYLDLDENGQLDAGEPSEVTDVNGQYRFTSAPWGTYPVREQLQSGWVQTYPSGDGMHVVTISSARPTSAGNNFGNSPAPVPLSIGDVSLAEGDSGTTSFVFIVSLSQSSSQTVTVDYTTADGTALADSDYQVTSGTLTFSPGEVSQPLAVLVNGDMDVEPDETFFVNLSNAANATIADGQGVGRIENDDFVSSAQVIRPDPLEQTVSSGDPVSITVIYSTANPVDETLTGLGLRIHYDSTRLTWDSFSDVFDYGKIVQDTGPSDDTSDFDDDPATDKYLTIAWADDLTGWWPGEGTTPLELYTANFTASISFTNGSTSVNFSASSTATGYSLDAQSASVDIIGPSQFRVDSLEAIPSGFLVYFNGPVASDVLNLYDTQANLYGPADFTVVGNTVGLIAGSLICSEDGTTVRFIKTGGPLEPGAYTVTLRSAADGFTDSEGNPLDGDADGTPGGDYVTTFVVESSTARLLSLPDFTRGPGQVVNVPATGSGIPITISDGTGLQGIDFVFEYDPALLTVTGVSLSSEMPGDWAMTYNLSTPGMATVWLYAPEASLPSGELSLVEIQASIPEDAPYGSIQLVGLSDIQIDEGAVAARCDGGVQVVAYLGDGTGNYRYSALDAAYLARVGVGLDSGFAAYPLKDPMLIGDVTGNGHMSALDAAYLARKGVGLDVPQIPDLPDGLPPIVPSGRDPLLSIPDDLTAYQGETLTVPVSILDDATDLLAVDLHLEYDTAVFDLTSSDIHVGDLTAGWTVAANVNDAAGTIAAQLFNTDLLSGGAGSVAEIDFHVRADAPYGPAVLDLTDDCMLNEGQLVVTLHDGLVRIAAQPAVLPFWSTYLGGSSDDYGLGVAVDTSGNVYVTGHSPSFGWTSGGFDTTHNGGADAFVAKFSPTGTHLWSTYLGGSSDDFASDIVVDASGNVYVAGNTYSSGWTSGGFDTIHNGASDVFVAKLSSTGSHIWSTYVGGGDNDYGGAIAVDASGNVSVTGRTDSVGWTSGGFDTAYDGGSDAFVAKLGPSGVHLWSTYLGGSSFDFGFGLVADALGNVYAMGRTDSAGWASGGFDTTHNGGPDAFAAKLDSSGAHLWSTYLGGSGNDYGSSVAVDALGNVYVTGCSESAGWTSGGFGTTHNGGGDAFVAKFSSIGAHFWSTYLGGSNFDYGYDIAMDISGNVYVTGSTSSVGWTSGGFDTILDGGDAFAAKLRSTGAHVWSTYLGGSDWDSGSGIAVDDSGGVYVTGTTDSVGWTNDGFDTTHNGGGDAFVMKLTDVSGSDVLIVTDADSIAVPEGSAGTFQLRLSAQPASDVTVSVSWLSGDGDITVSEGSRLTFTPSNWDTYQTVVLSAAEDEDMTCGTAMIRCSASGVTDKDVMAVEEDSDTPPFVVCDMNWDGFVSIIGDVPAFVQVAYFGDYEGYQAQFPGKDPVLPGDSNCDGLLSIVGDVPDFVNRVYFDNDIIAYKPNIYLYPEEPIELDVRIGFPFGGQVIASDPAYEGGWHITAAPSCLINEEHGHLFYESSQPDYGQYERGWVIATEDLEDFFRDNLVLTGFVGREIDDFVEYWVSRLMESPYYAIYPQYNEQIEQAVTLEFSVRPDSVIRLVYAMRGLESDDLVLLEPVVPPFTRSGFIVTEWGVVLK